MRPLFRGVAESIVNGNYFLFFIHLYAELAHLVERHLAKVEVASSSLVFRSTLKRTLSAFFYCLQDFMWVIFS